MNQRISPVSLLRHCADVASFYGFVPLRDIEKALPKEARRGRGGFHTFATSLDACTANMLQPARTRGSEPILAFWATTAPSHVPAGINPRDVGEFGMHVVGSPESLGEIVLLKTLFSILTEWGSTVSSVRLNALGDRDSKVRFERDLSAYLRRHTNELCLSCRTALAQNMFAAYSCTGEGCRELLLDAPRAMNFLSEKSRAHFREVLEYIESLGLPYEIDDLLVSDEREQRVVFSLETSEPDATVVASMGGRYDDYVRRMTNKKDGAAVSASLFFRKKGVNRSNMTPPAKSPQPKIYFVQLGARAKLQGLVVLDLLRASGVSVAQSFDANSLGLQLQSAREQGVKHLLIMGQREALDGTIIVRSMQNSSQQIVPVATLPRFLKTLKA